jgi:hypothetical protein
VSPPFPPQSLNSSSTRTRPRQEADTEGHHGRPHRILRRLISAKELAWHNSQAITGDPVAAVSALKNQHGVGILVVGSGVSR